MVSAESVENNAAMAVLSAVFSVEYDVKALQNDSILDAIPDCKETIFSPKDYSPIQEVLDSSVPQRKLLNTSYYWQAMVLNPVKVEKN